MVFPDFDPVVHIGSFALQWGPLAIRWYALAYVAGILLAWWYSLKLLRNARLWTASAPPPIETSKVDDLVLWGTLGIILGGRIGSILFYNTELIGRLFNDELHWADRLELFAIWHGGMSFHGGLIGVVLAVFFYARAKKIEPLRLGDLVAPCVPFGLFFGRVANFINGELWGRQTDLPWGISPRAGEDPVHPSQLYEALLEGVVLFIILRLATHRFGQLKRKGAITGLFLLCYGVFRILVEQVREPDADLWLGMSRGMALSIPMALIGLWLLIRSRQDGDVVAGSSVLAAAAGGPVIEAAAAEVAPNATAAAAPKPKAAPKSASKPKATPKPAPKPEPKSTAKPKAAAAPKKPAAKPASKPKTPTKPKPKPKPKS